MMANEATQHGASAPGAADSSPAMLPANVHWPTSLSSCSLIYHIHHFVLCSTRTDTTLTPWRLHCYCCGTCQLKPIAMHSSTDDNQPRGCNHTDQSLSKYQGRPAGLLIQPSQLSRRLHTMPQRNYALNTVSKPHMYLSHTNHWPVAVDV